MAFRRVAAGRHGTTYAGDTNCVSWESESLVVHWPIAKLLSPSRRPSFAIHKDSHSFSAMCAIKTWRHWIPSQSNPSPTPRKSSSTSMITALPLTFHPKIYRIPIIAFKALNFPAELIQSHPQLAEIWEGREVYSRLKVFAIFGALLRSRRKVFEKLIWISGCVEGSQMWVKILR